MLGSCNGILWECDLKTNDSIILHLTVGINESSRSIRPWAMYKNVREPKDG